MDAGLVKGEGFAVDASVMEADASRYHGKAPDEIDWSAPERQTRAVAEFLSGLDDEDPKVAGFPSWIRAASGFLQVRRNACRASALASCSGCRRK
jgi:hypothetical protein